MIRCPLCDCELHKLTRHLSQVHKINKDTFMTLYPGYPLEDEESHKRRSEAAKLNWSDERREMAAKLGAEKFRKFNKSQWNGEAGERRRISRSKHFHEQVLHNSDVQSKAAESRIGVVSDTRSETMKEKWKDSEYAESVIRNSHSQLAKMKKFPNGYFRSSWESKLAENLTNIGVSFSYESLILEYTIAGKLRHHVTDFYVEDLNLIIEVKPSEQIQDPIVQAKAMSARKQGYRYVFADKKSIFKDFDSFWSSVIEGATTIERIADN